MVKSTGAQYVILGHSERRQYYHETAEILKEKVQLALANGLKVIFCCGETLEEREANKQNEVVKAELDGSVFNLSAEEWKNIVLRTSYWLTSRSGLLAQVRLLPVTRPKRCSLTSVASSLRSTAKRLLRTQPSSMAVAASPATLRSSSLSLTSTAVRFSEVR